MNKHMEKLILLSMDFNCEKNLEQIYNLLMKIFDADAVEFLESAVVDRKMSLSNTIYLPILINGKLTCYYKIINPKKEIEKNDSNLIVSVLSKMHGNILKYHALVEEMRTDKQTGLYSKNYFNDFCQYFDYNGVKSINCVFIDVNGLKEINRDYGYDGGNIVIKNVSNSIKRVFSNSNMISFRVGGDKFVILIIDGDYDNTTERVKYLKEYLKYNDISISTGISIDYGKFDLINLIKLAHKRMIDDKNIFYFSEASK